VYCVVIVVRQSYLWFMVQRSVISGIWHAVLPSPCLQSFLCCLCVFLVASTFSNMQGISSHCWIINKAVLKSCLVLNDSCTNNLILIIGRFDCLTGLTKFSLLRWGDGWAGRGWWQAADVCTTSRPSHCSTLYQLPQQQADVMRACMFTLQHVDCAGIGKLWTCGSFASRCLHTSYLFT